MPPLAIMGGIMAAGSIAGGAISANAAGNAADAQANAAIQAANIQAQQADKALQFQKDQYYTGQQELSPWLQAGTAGLANLMNLMGLPVSGNATIPGAGPAVPSAPGAVGKPGGPQIGSVAGTMMPGGGTSVRPGLRSPLVSGGRFGEDRLEFGNSNLTRPTTVSQGATHQVPLASLINSKLGPAGFLAQPFVPPTALTEQNDPGYKARLNLATDQLQRSAAARGGLLTGGTAKALDQFSQDYASNEYGNVYNRALDTFQTNRHNLLDPLMAISGLGQSTGTAMLSAGNNSANSIANTLMTLGQMQGNAYQNAGAARASGYVGGANAWTGALNNTAQFMQLPLLLNMLRNGGSVDLSGVPMSPGGDTWNPLPGTI